MSKPCWVYCELEQHCSEQFYLFFNHFITQLHWTSMLFSGSGSNFSNKML